VRRPFTRFLVPCFSLVWMVSLLLAIPAGAQEKLDPEHPVTVFRLTDDGSITIKFSVQSAGSASYIAADGETLALDGKTGSKFSFLIADYSEPLLVSEKDGEVLLAAADGKLDEASTGSDLLLDSALLEGNGAGFGPPNDTMPIRFRIPKWFPRVGGCYFGAAYDPTSKCTFMIVVCYDANGKITGCRMGHFCPGMRPTISNCTTWGFPGNGVPPWFPGPGNVPGAQQGAASSASGGAVQ